jgi:hypothetical protein
MPFTPMKHETEFHYWNKSTQCHIQNICRTAEHSELWFLDDIQQILSIGKVWQCATEFKVNSISAGQLHFLALCSIIFILQISLDCCMMEKKFIITSGNITIRNWWQCYLNILNIYCSTQVLSYDSWAISPPETIPPLYCCWIVVSWHVLPWVL